jgi:hypothetical protein
VDFDPKKASTAALIRQGLTWKRPMRGDPPSLHVAWERAFARRWHPKDRAVPALEPRPGKTHALRGLSRTSDGAYASANWSGGVMQGLWTSVVGYWTIPIVTKPAAAPEADAGWDSASWIGIDGFASPSVLQAGVQHRVGANGQTDYVAWYQWWAPPQSGSPDYIWQTNIVNFPVGPGQQIYCSVQYIHNRTAGQIHLANEATGQHFSLTLAPPPGAHLGGDSIQWIMEATDVGEPNGSLPNFTPVQFSTAIGCSADGRTVADPQSADSIRIVFNNQPLTSVALTHDEVTIHADPMPQ